VADRAVEEGMMDSFMHLANDGGCGNDSDPQEIIPQLPEGCGYQGYEFGAAYPDSICFGGRLYDADDRDNEGNYYEPTEEIPCPMCHPRKAILYHTHTMNGPYRERYAAAKGLVASIRHNRRNHTEPWKTNKA
jgi:hypothetical protein